MCRIKITNKHHGHQPDGDRRIYIGRGSPLGNPFPITPALPRDQAIAAYRPWLMDKIAANDPAVCNALNDIAAKSMSGGVDLVCYCAPKHCHGEVIKEIITNVLANHHQ
jgi:hypothetical protein